MKMNRTTSTHIAGFLSALVVTGVCSSAQVDKESIASKCEGIYKTLDGMLEEHRSAPCADSVQYAGGVTLGASGLVRAERYQNALKNLSIAEAHLGRVYSKSQACAYFSPKVKPPLDEVRYLMAKLEHIPN